MTLWEFVLLVIFRVFPSNVLIQLPKPQYLAPPPSWICPCSYYDAAVLLVNNGKG